MARATLRLTLACNNRCTFCCQQGLAESAAAPSLFERLRELRGGADELTFVGGEPTLSPGLAGAVQAAREAGFSRVGVQTNAHRFCDPGYARSLAGAGLTDLQVTVQGEGPAAHDYHTGVDGSFAALMKGVGNATANGLEVVAATVLTRSAFRGLSGLPGLLRSRGVLAWLLAVPRVAGRAADGFDRVVPRLGMALPYALHALEAASKLELPSWIRGAPLCALGPLAGRALSGPPRAFGEACQGCAARPGCPGIEESYRARFGEGELSRLSAAPPPGGLHRLARLFVGPGELSPRPSLRVEPCPEEARAALLSQGKVKRAVGEVAPGGPRQSGEALKELFPSLFGGAKEPPA